MWWWLEAVRRWALSDRIRASPREDKLLRLPVGACVRIGDTVAQVTARIPGDSASDGCEVAYTCRSAAAEFHLCVSLRSEAPIVRVRVRQDGWTREVAVHEVETFG